MGSDRPTPQKGYTRSEFLRKATLGLAALAALGLSIRGLLRPTRRKPQDTPLPGEGSIFQPRQDKNLERWLKQQHQGS